MTMAKICTDTDSLITRDIAGGWWCCAFLLATSSSLKCPKTIHAIHRLAHHQYASFHPITTQAFGFPFVITRFARLLKNPDVFLYASGRIEKRRYKLNDILRTLGLRAIAKISAHELIAEMPLAVVQRISCMKKVLSELFTILCQYQGEIYCGAASIDMSADVYWFLPSCLGCTVLVLLVGELFLFSLLSSFLSPRPPPSLPFPAM